MYIKLIYTYDSLLHCRHSPTWLECLFGKSSVSVSYQAHRKYQVQRQREEITARKQTDQAPLVLRFRLGILTIVKPVTGPTTSCLVSTCNQNA